MPPRFVYWTILIDGKPTAFRGREQAELLPTFKQLCSKNPDAVMKWVQGGRLWDSPEEARLAAARRRQRDLESRGRAARAARPGGGRDPRRGGST
jgi:hypothetical protein